MTLVTLRDLEARVEIGPEKVRIKVESDGGTGNIHFEEFFIKCVLCLIKSY